MSVSISAPSEKTVIESVILYMFYFKYLSFLLLKNYNTSSIVHYGFLFKKSVLSEVGG